MSHEERGSRGIRYRNPDLACLCVIGILNNLGEGIGVQPFGATVTSLEVFQAATYVVALASYYANRHVPGFLPDRGPSPGTVGQDSRAGPRDQEVRAS